MGIQDWCVLFSLFIVADWLPLQTTLQCLEGVQAQNLRSQTWASATNGSFLLALMCSWQEANTTERPLTHFSIRAAWMYRDAKPAVLCSEYYLQPFAMECRVGAAVSKDFSLPVLIIDDMVRWETPPYTVSDPLSLQESSHLLWALPYPFLSLYYGGFVTRHCTQKHIHALNHRIISVNFFFFFLIF